MITLLSWSAVRTMAALAVSVSMAVSPLSHESSPGPEPFAADGSAVWSWPLDPIPDVLRPFDLPHPYSAGHRGVDLSAAAGAPVIAPDDGTVHFVGWVVDRPVISISHANGLLSSFEPVAAVVAKGDAVVRGEVIGHLSEQPIHAPSGGLHLGARDGEAYVDPLALLGAVPRAVLLPLSASRP